MPLPSDTHYATLRADLESDAQDLEAESWSLAVEPQHVKKHSKETVKRQDVIYGKCDSAGCCCNTLRLTALSCHSGVKICCSLPTMQLMHVGIYVCPSTPVPMFCFLNLWSSA